MPVRISAGVGDHPCFLIMIRIESKITNFPYTCCLRDHHTYFLVHAQLILSGNL